MKYIRHRLVSTDGKSHSIYFMREDGKSFCRLYFFYDIKSYGCMDNLSVHPSIRKQGEGTRLQKLRESILKRLGYKYAMLWVKKDSWMNKWYQRRGYKFYCNHEREKGCDWLRKRL